MMPFAEKLSFLMHLTQTSNKELAAELCVEPDYGRTVAESRTAEPAVRLHLILAVSWQTGIYRKNFTESIF